MNLPAPGTAWKRRGDGATYHVININRHRILLQSPVDVVAVPVYQWPANFTSLPDVADDGFQVLVGFVVGGSTGHHWDRLRDLAANLDVDLQYHWEGKGKKGKSVRPTIPADVDLVVLLISHMGHSHQAIAKAMAQKSNVPIAMVSSHGFEPQLAAELVRLGLRPEGFSAASGYGALAQSRVDTWYEWDEDHGIWKLEGTPIQPLASHEDALQAQCQENRFQLPFLGLIALAGTYWAGTKGR